MSGWVLFVLLVGLLLLFVELSLCFYVWLAGRSGKQPPVWVSISIWFIAALLLLTGVFWGFSLVYGHGTWPDSTKEPDWLRQVMYSTVPAAGILGASVAVALSLRRHQLESTEAERSVVRDLRARYTTAAEQLGHDKAAIRLAGVYALAALADDWIAKGARADAQTCIELLCAYMRTPAKHHQERDLNAEYQLTPDDVAEVEVRASIISTVAAHLRRVGRGTAPAWSGFEFNFRGARIDTAADFIDIDLRPDTTLVFTGANFGVPVNFTSAQFGDNAAFANARFGNRATFRDARFGNNAVFTGAQFGNEATFRDARFGNNAVFTGAQFGNEAEFPDTQFGNDAIFFRAQFGNMAQFLHAQFGNNAVFVGVQFGDMVSFRDTHFGDGARFQAAEFGGEVSFTGTQFSGAVVGPWGETPPPPVWPN